jgi:hypothetical protein
MVTLAHHPHFHLPVCLGVASTCPHHLASTQLIQKSINRTIRKVSHCLSYRVCINTHAGCCCTPLYIGAVSATLAIAALLPMAWIPFWVSPLHFVAAAVVFIMLVRRPI